MKTIFHNRLEKLQQSCSVSDLDGFLLEDPLDLFYFTGLNLSKGKLLVGSEQITLFVDGRYIQAAQKNSPVSCLLDELETFSTQVKEMKRLGFNGEKTSYEHFLHLQKLPSLLVSATALLKKIRYVKDETEIKALKKSAALLWKGFEHIQSLLRIGITEREIAKRFEIFCLEQGAEKLSFEPIIAFGQNGAMPHYRAGDVPLKEGDCILIDIGVVLNHYYSDMTRVLFFGPENPHVKQLYTIAQRAQKAALSRCKPGALIKEIDLAARQVFREENVEELFVHSLGHGVGLEIHEFPRLKWDAEDKDVGLEEGVVFTVEPGLYLPGVGGVRYEDTVVITKDGYENFYPS